MIEQLYATQCWTDPTAARLVERCLDLGLQVAIVSNSTSFWFPRQMRASGLDRMQDRLGLYLSHEIGFSKTHQRGGLKLLAEAVNPVAILFVDDRAENISFAETMGMRTVLFQNNTYRNVRTVVEPLLTSVI